MKTNCLEIVEGLNHEQYEAHGEVETSFWFRTNGYVEQIGFEEKTLWCSENDDRDYIEDTDELIDLSYHIRKRFNEYADQLSEQKFNFK